MSHTPGPWAIRHFGKVPAAVVGGVMRTYVNGSAQDQLFAVMGVQPDNGGSEATRANALLLAAAPDLLEALEMLYSETADYIRLNNLGGMDNQCMQLARAAIAKATGETR